MARDDRRGGAADGVTVGDVADLVLAGERGRELTQPLLAPGDEHAVPAVGGELARERLADAGGRPGDHGDAAAAGGRVRGRARGRLRAHSAPLKTRKVVRLISTVCSIGSA